MTQHLMSPPPVVTPATVTSPADAAPTATAMASAGTLEVRLARNAVELTEAQRLRYQVFYREMAARPSPEMAAAGRDFDRFDEICDCLLVCDRTRPPGRRVVGTYRLLRQEVAEATGGFYSADEFDLTALLAQLSDGCRGLELGRSCVDAGYRNNATIQLLWRGITSYLVHHRIGYMFGCASLPGIDAQALAPELSYLHHFHRAPPELRVTALDHRRAAVELLAAEALSPRRVLAALPPLIKGYLRLGAYIGDGAVIDHQFATTDVFIILPVERLSQRYVSHFDPQGEIAKTPAAAGRPQAAAAASPFARSRA